MLQVIGVGFGRTGTLSLKRALELLGVGRCYHFIEMTRSGHVGRWLRVARGEAPDWTSLFSGYGATTDWPAAHYYRELAAAFPDARFVLTVRDAGSWYRSMATTLERLRELVPAWVPGLRGFAELTDRIIWNGTFDGRFADRDHAIACFEAHSAAVCATLPPARLLVFDVREGWPPLCAFLDLAAPPDTPFPHVNDARAVRRYIRLLKLARVLLAGLLAVMVLAVAARCMR